MAEVEDTYVSWIDNLSESERVSYLARCEELRIGYVGQIN